MGMVVRSNIMAVNANRQLGMNSSAVTKSLEKLSSGFKINRAGDDASGLAISEKMKAQIKGLETASANSQDGISLIQTAEGALTEVHSMLNRMTELATKSANGTIQDEVDRENVQQEVNALISEIDRIGDSTNFNGINLIDGSLSGTGGGARGVPNIKNLALADTAATAKVGTTGNFTTVTTTAGEAKYSFSTKDANGRLTTTEITLKIDAATIVASDGTVYTGTGAGEPTAAQLQTAVLGELAKTGLAEKFTFSANGNAIDFTSKATGSGADELVLTSMADADLTDPNVNTAVTTTGGADAFQSHAFTNADIGREFSVGGKKFVFSDSGDVSSYGNNVTVLQVAADGTLAAADVDKMALLIEQQTGYLPTVNGLSLEFKGNISTAAGSGDGLTLQIGDTAAEFNKVTVSVEDMRANGLGVSGLDVSTQDSAKTSIETIKEAINKVSTNRGNLGALQNRLEYTINNLDVTAENMTAANSRIRDTDMAKQMMDYTKMNVLNQAAQAMLAQANQQPQSILQLLQ